MTGKARHFYMNSAEELDAVFGIYKKSFWEQLLLHTAFNYAAGLVLMIILVPIYFVFVFSMLSSAIGSSFSPDSFLSAFGPVFLLLVIAVVFLLILFDGVITLPTFFMTKQLFYGEKKSMGRAFSLAFKAIPRCLGAAVLKALICSTPCVILIPMAFSDASWVFSGRAVGFIITSLSLFALAVVVLNTLFIFAVPAAAHEKITLFAAIKKGYTLIKGSFWRILGIILIISLVSSVLSYSITSGIQIGGMVLGESLGAEGLMIIIILFQYLISFVLGTITGPIGGILTAVLFFNQKVKKDGLDIEINLSKLEGETR